MTRTITPSELNHLARLGALARLAEIEEEAAAIRRMFPGLKPPVPGGSGQPASRPARKARRKRVFSAEAREAARQRMKAYWAKRKGEGASPAGAGAGDSASADRPASGATKRKAKGRRGRKKAA